MQRVLVLEHNQKMAERLVTALKQIENLSVSLVPTMREACLIVAQTPQDLAFIPLGESQQLVQALRAFQVDLKLVITTADSQLFLSNDYRQDFYGLLHLDHLEKELPTILRGLELETPSVPSPETRHSLPPGFERFREFCQEIGLGEQTAIKMAILSADGQIIGSFGTGTKENFRTVLSHLDESLSKGKYSARFQYLELSDFYDARLVYSILVGGSVLTLVAAPDAPVGEVRKTAEKLAYLLSWTGRKENEQLGNRFWKIGSAPDPVPEPRQRTSFVIAWRPIRPLPLILQNVVWDCLSLIAAENDCKLDYLSIKADIIHLVIECPAGKTAAWVTHVLKSGINDEIQRQFGVKFSIWRKGFYASESQLPLNEVELNMMLSS